MNAIPSRSGDSSSPSPSRNRSESALRRGSDHGGTSENDSSAISRRDRAGSILIVLLFATILHANMPIHWRIRVYSRLHESAGETVARAWWYGGTLLEGVAVVTGSLGIWGMYDRVPRETSSMEVTAIGPDGARWEIPTPGNRTRPAEWFFNDHWGLWDSAIRQNREAREIWVSGLFRDDDRIARIEIAFIDREIPSPDLTRSGEERGTISRRSEHFARSPL